MPKQTFFNLPEEKKTRIVEVAIKEFSKNTFLNASVTKIAENAGIAKGSIYQYFEDKKDLYKYMLEIAAQRKMTYFMDYIQNMNDLDFFDLIRGLYVQGIIFAKENPELASIANNFLKENDAKFKEEILGEGYKKSDQFFEELIEKAKAKGQLNPHVDTRIGASMLTTLSTTIVDDLLHDMAYEDIISNEERLLERVDKMLFIMRNGFKV
ncbi:MAG: TetR/AcrR family transcriptional regulator [Bacillota bacterium]